MELFKMIDLKFENTWDMFNLFSPGFNPEITEKTIVSQYFRNLLYRQQEELIFLLENVCFCEQNILEGSIKTDNAEKSFDLNKKNHDLLINFGNKLFDQCLSVMKVLLSEEVCRLISNNIEYKGLYVYCDSFLYECEECYYEQEFNPPLSALRISDFKIIIYASRSFVEKKYSELIEDIMSSLFLHDKIGKTTCMFRSDDSAHKNIKDLKELKIKAFKSDAYFLK